MFWKYNTTSSPKIEAVLNKEDVTLRELMDVEDILQECKSQNKKLLEFLVRPDVLDELVTLTTVEPSPELDERTRYKYSNIACELLTCDVPVLNEKLLDEKILEKLYVFIESDPPLNPLLASFFSKTLSLLMSQRGEQNWYSFQMSCLQVLDFLKTKENCVPLLVKHIGTSAIMDLMLKFITNIDCADVRENVLNWLDSHRIVQSLVCLIDPSVDAYRQSNAAQLLSDVIARSREVQFNCSDRTFQSPVVSAIESVDTITLLLDHMLGPEKSETSIVSGIQVLIALLNFKQNNPLMDTNTYGGQVEDVAQKEHRQKVVHNTTTAIIPRLKDFHCILIDPPKKVPVKTTVGVLDPPLGNTRLQVTRLLSALIATESVELRKEITRLDMVNVLLDMFFKYTWNNFLHTQVQQCIAFALNSTSEKNDKPDDMDENLMFSHLFTDCRLLGRILEAWDDNEQKQSKSNGIRRGYMGHLVNIANNIVQQSEKSPLGSYIKENVSNDTVIAWEAFVSGALDEINKKHQTFLGGSHPSQCNADDNHEDYRDIPFPQAAILHQQVYQEYQMQPMASQFIESYGYHDEEFNEGEDPLHSSVDRLTSMNFNISDSDLDRQAELFNQVCAQNINTLDDAEDDIWEDREQEGTYQTVIDKNAREWTHSSNSDDDDQPIAKMDVDTNDPWMNSENVSEGAIAPVTAIDPWEVANEPAAPTAASAVQDNWADFSSASFDSFETNFSSTSTTVETKELSKEDAAKRTESKEEEKEDDEEKTGNGDVTEKQNPSQLPIEAADTNANISSKEHTESNNKDQELIDNYHFLSSQGMMGGAVDVSTVEEESENVIMKNMSVEENKLDIQQNKDSSTIVSSTIVDKDSSTVKPVSPTPNQLPNPSEPV